MSISNINTFSNTGTTSLYLSGSSIAPAAQKTVDTSSIPKSVDKTQIMPQPNSYEQATKTKNQAIMGAQVNLSVKAGNESLSLLYKTALASINKNFGVSIEKSFGENTVEKVFASALDTSPQATADRIVKGATDFFTSFKADRPELADDEALSNFLTIISDGIDEGFKEAKNILKSLSILNGNIENDITSTYDLVQKGLTDFREKFSAKEGADPIE